MDIYRDINLLECPLCGGPSLLEEENKRYFYVSCLDCGCHTAEVEYRSPDKREAAAQMAADLWNLGKVTSSNPGE